MIRVSLPYHLRKLADDGEAKGDRFDGEWSAT